MSNNEFTLNGIKIETEENNKEFKNPHLEASKYEDKIDHNKENSIYSNVIHNLFNNKQVIHDDLNGRFKSVNNDVEHQEYLNTIKYEVINTDNYGTPMYLVTMPNGKKIVYIPDNYKTEQAYEVEKGLLEKGVIVGLLVASPAILELVGDMSSVKLQKMMLNPQSDLERLLSKKINDGRLIKHFIKKAMKKGTTIKQQIIQNDLDEIYDLKKKMNEEDKLRYKEYYNKKEDLHNQKMMSEIDKRLELYKEYILLSISQFPKTPETISLVNKVKSNKYDLEILESTNVNEALTNVLVSETNYDRKMREFINENYNQNITLKNNL